MEEEGSVFKLGKGDVEGGGDASSSFKHSSFASGDGDTVTRHGNWLTASGHIITAVIGAGVLSLPYSVGMLGWVGGITSLLFFAWVTLFTSQLLVELHVLGGRRIATYVAVVEETLGRRGRIALFWFQYPNLVLTALAYNITAASSLQHLAQSICGSAGTESCFDKYWAWAAIFGALQLFMAQIPNLDAAVWASVVGAVMSFGYSLIALGRSIAEIAKGEVHGTIGGIPAGSADDKVFGVFNSLGAIMFAYSFSQILIEIQDTIKDSAKGGPVGAMRKAVNWSVAIMTTFYVTVGVTGYMAYGDNTQGDILMSFKTPTWVVDMATIMVIVHMVPAYQIWSQPVFAMVESWVGKKNLPPIFKGLTFRLWFRSLYVIVLTIIASGASFFSLIVGLVGATGFWPCTVLFPIEAWMVVYKPSPRRRFWLRALSFVCLVATIVALVGSVQQMAVASYCFFC